MPNENLNPLWGVLQPWKKCFLAKIFISNNLSTRNIRCCDAEVVDFCNEHRSDVPHVCHACIQKCQPKWILRKIYFIYHEAGIRLFPGVVE